MKNPAITFALTKTMVDLLSHAIELEEALEQVEDESRQWLAISDELNDVRREIGWCVEYEYKLLPG